MNLNEAAKKAVLAIVAQGKCVVVGEYVGAKPETINYIAKSGAGAGKQASFSRVSTTVLLGDGNGTGVEAVKANISVPDGTTAEKHMAALKLPARGTVVVAEVESIEIDKGNKTFRVASLTPAGLVS